MDTFLFILLIALMFVGVPLLLPRFIVWLTETRVTGKTVSPSSAPFLSPTGEETISKGTVSSSEGHNSLGAIPLLRFIAGLILAVVWPLATLSLPFMLDDPREVAVVGRFIYLALYVAYPLVFFISAEKYKAQLRIGHYAKALTLAAAPLGVLAAFLLFLWAVNN